MLFGDKIRELRQAQDLTQPQLAEQLGVEQSWLSKIENNKCLPSSEFVQQVCDTFGISLNELLAELDEDYLQKQLSTIPEVKQLLQIEGKQRFHSRKRWIIASSIASVIGAVLLYSALLNLLFPATTQRYVSNGIVYAGEPWNLYEDPENIFSQLKLFEVPEELNDQYNQYEQMVGELNDLFLTERGRFVQEVLARRDFAEIMSMTSAVEYIVRPGYVAGEAVDIYGNTAEQGQRIYELHDRVRPNLLNSAVWILGYLFFIGSLFGFFLDYRLSRLKV